MTAPPIDVSRPKPPRVAVIGAEGAALAVRLAAAGWEVAQVTPGAGSVTGAVAGAALVIEAGPDREAYKRKMLQRIQSHAAPGTPVAVLSALPVEALRGCATRPAEIMALRLEGSGWVAEGGALPRGACQALRSSLA